MRDKVRNQVIPIAHETRLVGEKIQQRFPNFFSHKLTGLCGICSYILFKRLIAECDGAIKFAGNNLHSFVYVDDWIVDVTATQFDKNGQIYFVEKSKIKPIPMYWQPNLIGKTVGDMRHFFINCDWPDQQNPYSSFWKRKFDLPITMGDVYAWYN